MVATIEDVFEYERLLSEAKQRFLTKEQVNSITIMDWFREMRWTQFINYQLLEKLMFKLRQGLWNSFE